MVIGDPGVGVDPGAAPVIRITRAAGLPCHSADTGELGSSGACAISAGVPECGEGIDNDRDGLIELRPGRRSWPLSSRCSWACAAAGDA